jgi:NAD(P)-dependent dehydrogenase (short-subunit alcohol dehydrogenase family)
MVNLFGAFYMIKAAIRPMLKAHAGRLASDEAAYITGQVLAVDGGLVMQ